MVVNGLENHQYDSVLASYLEPGEGMEVYFMTALEQDLFIHLLYMNRKHISPAFVPPWNAKMQQFKFSFFLPITKLRKSDIKRLSQNSGCLVCGKKTLGICRDCQVAQYCGKSTFIFQVR
jgi:hypothetical protein